MIKLDLLDKKILYELDTNARIPLTQLAKKTRSSVSVVEYRMKKMEKESLIKNYLTFLDAGKLGLMIWNVYLELQNTTEQKEEEILNYLSNVRETWWIATCSGKWDLIFSIGVHDVKEFYEVVTNFHNKFGEYVLNQSIEAHADIEIISRGYFLEKPGKNSGWYKEISKPKLDLTDKKILKIMSKNARLGAVEIASKTNLTARVVSYRIKELMKKGIINRFRLDLDISKIGKNFYKTIIKTKNFTQEKKEQLKKYCINEGNIIHFEEKIGPWLLELEFDSDSYSEADKQMKKIKETFQDFVQSYEILLIREEIKSDFDLTKTI